MRNPAVFTLLIVVALLAGRETSAATYYVDDSGSDAAPGSMAQPWVTLQKAATDGRWALNVQDASTGNVVINNIFYSAHSLRGAFDICADCLDGLVSDFNAIEDRFTTDGGNNILTLVQWQLATGQDMASVATTPAALFTNPDADDYTLLQPSSPALDAGAARAEVLHDLIGTPRPQGLAFDIGAYETVSVDEIFRNGFEDELLEIGL